MPTSPVPSSLSMHPKLTIGHVLTKINLKYAGRHFLISSEILDIHRSDDGFFSAQEDKNYLVKTSSRTQITTLTKVQTPLSHCNGDIEEIQQILITDFKTLLPIICAKREIYKTVDI
ncbi:uncharacterized protein ACN427_013717 [Glossina fuscipes fuscipes]